MATIGCGISWKYIKHTNKCSNIKTKTTKKQNYETTDTFSKYYEDNTKKIHV